jgi:hypothetical protein
MICLCALRAGWLSAVVSGGLLCRGSAEEAQDMPRAARCFLVAVFL